MKITYAELSLYPFHQREEILQDLLVQFAWELLSLEDHPGDHSASSQSTSDGNASA